MTFDDRTDNKNANPRRKTVILCSLAIIPLTISRLLIKHILKEMMKLICILYWTRCSWALVSPVHRMSQTHHGVVQLQMSTVQTLAPKVREHKLPVIDIDADVKSSSFPSLRSKRSVKTIPSGQSQIPVHIRIIKVSVHDTNSFNKSDSIKITYKRLGIM